MNTKITLLFDDVFCCIEDAGNEVINWNFDSRWGGQGFHKIVMILLSESQFTSFIGDTKREFKVSEKKINEALLIIEKENIKI